MTKALQGIKVLDLSRILAGPYCTQVLGDLGAEVIKIERPGAGDDTRYWGPPYLQNSKGQNTTESAYYLSANRNKKSVAIDISHPEGQALIHQLLESSDVLVHNFKVGGLEKYGLEYSQLKEKYPQLIYCAITGFGQTGPMAQEPGYDFMAQAISGLMACTGEIEGEPMKVGVALTDVITGLNAVTGILAALNARHQAGKGETGKGQMIDLSLLDCSIASLTNIAQYYLTSGNPAPRQGNAHPSIVPYQNFKTADGYLVIAVGNDAQFSRFCTSIDKPEFATDNRFIKNADRVENREILCAEIQLCLISQTTEIWLDTLKANNVPCAPVNTMDQVFDMPQVQHREMTIQMQHPFNQQPQTLVGSPLKLSGTPVSYEQAPPICGQHTNEILINRLHLGEDAIKQLREQKIIG